MTSMTSMTELATVEHRRPTVLHENLVPGTVRRGGRWVLVADVLGALAALALIQVAAALPADLAAPAVLTWALVLVATGRRPAAGLTDQVRVVVVAGLVLAAVCWLLPLAVSVPADDRHLATAVGIAVLTAVVARVIGVLVHSRARVRVLLVGAGVEVARAAAELRRARGRRWEVVAVCAEDLTADGVGDAVAGSGADAVLVLPSDTLRPEAVRRIAWQAERSGADLYVGTGVLDVARARTRLVAAGGLGMMHVRHPAHSGLRRLAKDVVERFACALLVVVLAPILLGIVVAIRRDSHGPAVFRQQRVGRNGRLFTMYKFRTMTTDAEALKPSLDSSNDCDGVLFKMRVDPRITRIGALLRRYSLDELPQLFNVIAGHMSLVGPRPALPEEVRRYSLDPRRRLVVKPGVTGLWQVSGRSDLSWDESVRLDLQYVDNWSLGLDAAIVGRTLGAVLGHRGAY